MSRRTESVETGTDLVASYLKSYLLIGSRIPFLKAPLFIIGSLALAAKGVERILEKQKEKELMATVVPSGQTLWTLDETEKT